MCADVHRKGKKSHKEELKRKINGMSQIALQMVALSVSKGNKKQVERTCGMKHCCPSSTPTTHILTVCLLAKHVIRELQ